jgi:hypothetical protein
MARPSTGWSVLHAILGGFWHSKSQHLRETNFAPARSRPETERAQPPPTNGRGFYMIDYILNLLYERSLGIYLSALPKVTQK